MSSNETQPTQPKRESTHEEQIENSIHMLYNIAGNVLLSKLNEMSPDTKEANEKWADNFLINFKPYHLMAVSSATQFFEMWNQHVVRSKDPIPRPVFFQMNNLEVLFQRYAPALNQAALNRVPVGGIDPTLEFKPLPYNKLKNSGGLDADGKVLSIPIKFETFDKIGYGFVELFQIEEPHPIEKGKTVKLMTEYIAVRVGDNYIAPNLIYRYKDVTKKEVMEAWHTKKSLVTKKTA